MGMNSDFDAAPLINKPFSSEAETLADLELGDAEALVADYGDLPLQDVEVRTDKAEGRQRQISAKIYIPHPTEQVWQILTDYDHLADFIPNLTRSQRIDHPQGGIRIEQIGAESLLKLKFCARVVLDMVEHFPHRLDFEMVEGDFKLFRGNWTLHPLAENATELSYHLTVLPHRLMPVAMIERRLRAGMVLNLSAIRQQADRLFAANA
jgi:ribosome-associated toxin RatA of RatAB toxin-antitoxin module